MTAPETTPSRLHALAADAELYGEGCREYARGLRAAAIELEADERLIRILRDDRNEANETCAALYALVVGKPPGDTPLCDYEPDVRATLAAREALLVQAMEAMHALIRHEDADNTRHSLEPSLENMTARALAAEIAEALGGQDNG